MSLDRIEVTPFALIAGELLQNRRSGSLTIVRGHSRRVAYWSQGELVLISSDAPEESLPDFLVRRGVLAGSQAVEFFGDDPSAVVARFHESGLLTMSARQTLLREWLAGVFIALFSIDEGTVAFTDDEPIDADRRVFVQSTAALILEGIRSITNGLVLRRCLGDLKREVEPARDSRFGIESMALTDAERRIASAMEGPQQIESFLRHFPAESGLAAKVMIGMLALGYFTAVDSHAAKPSTASLIDMQRDMELLAAIGSTDTSSLRAVALSRQLGSIDHYHFLDLPRAAARAQIVTAAEAMRRTYNPSIFPPIVREAVQAIARRIDEALAALQDPARRAAYDKLLAQSAGSGAGGEGMIQQRLTQRSIAMQNYNHARQLSSQNDFYGAIVLLKQAVNYVPDLADAWVLLGLCQERNPKWRRDAAESFQRALSADPNHVEAMLALGDLYKTEGMVGRAQACYEDVLKIAADNAGAASRLQALRKR